MEDFSIAGGNKLIYYICNATRLLFFLPFSRKPCLKNHLFTHTKEKWLYVKNLQQGVFSKVLFNTTLGYSY
ncbi:UNVERIFIED_CONTAM: hypothetical protein NCL1_56412 [Trichonephila clavipes]